MAIHSAAADDAFDEDKLRSANANITKSGPGYKGVLVEALRARWAANAAKQRALDEAVATREEREVVREQRQVFEDIKVRLCTHIFSSTAVVT
eukprot:SAG31_NODE_7_length_42755_cov_130.245728_18_plen_93_part_00